MKKTLFVHDHVFIGDDQGNVYSEGKLTNAVFLRYRECADELSVLCRMRVVGKTSNLDKIDLGFVSFFPVKGLAFGKIFTLHLIRNLISMWKLVLAADLIILRLPSFLGIFSYFLCLLFRKKYAVELVGNPEEAIINSGAHNVLRKKFAQIFSWLNKKAVRRAIGTIYVTKSTLQIEYPCNGIVAAASNVVLNVCRENPRKNYAIFPEKIVIGVIGSYANSYKGIDLAISLIGLLRSRGVLAELRILGSGQVNKFQGIIDEFSLEDAVSFDGLRNGGQDVYDWLDGLDIYVQPSRTEGLPRSLIEAMARGLPCVASRVGGMPELLHADFLFSSDDIEEFSSIVMRLIDSDSLRAQAGSDNYLESMQYDNEILSLRRQNFWKQVALKV